MRSRSVIYLALAAGVFMLSASGVFAKVARAPAGIIAYCIKRFIRFQFTHL